MISGASEVARIEQALNASTDARSARDPPTAFERQDRLMNRRWADAEEVLNVASAGCLRTLAYAERYWPLMPSPET